MRGQNGRNDNHVRPGGDAIPRAIPREITLFGNGYGNNYCPRNWHVSENKMGNYSDGDREDHKEVKAVMAEKPADTSKLENVSHNEIKLAKHVSNNFIENSTLLLTKNNKAFCEQHVNHSGDNLDSSDEQPGEMPEESRQEHFHSDKAVATPVLRENLCAEDEPCKSFAF